MLSPDALCRVVVLALKLIAFPFSTTLPKLLFLEIEFQVLSFFLEICKIQDLVAQAQKLSELNLKSAGSRCLKITQKRVLFMSIFQPLFRVRGISND